MKRISILLFILSIFIQTGKSQDATNIVAILCGQTSVFDIGSGCQTNLDKVSDMVEDIGNVLDIDVNIITVSGRDYTKDNILSQLNGLELDNPESTIVIFYGTGHGFNYQNEASQFAFLGAHPSRRQLSASEFHEFGLSLELEIHGILMRKNPRLLITLGEACNNVIALDAPQTLLSEGLEWIPMSPNSDRFERYRELFLDMQGDVISTSSRYGEYSWIDTTATGGGVWTNQFLMAFNDAVSSSESANWEDIFDTAQASTREATTGMKIPQNPVYDMNWVGTPMELDENPQKTSKPKGKTPKVKLEDSGYIAPKVKIIQYDKTSNDQ